MSGARIRAEPVGRAPIADCACQRANALGLLSRGAEGVDN